MFRFLLNVSLLIIVFFNIGAPVESKEIEDKLSEIFDKNVDGIKRSNFFNKKIFPIYMGGQSQNLSEFGPSEFLGEIGSDTGIVTGFIPSIGQNMVLLKYNSEYQGDFYCKYGISVSNDSSFSAFLKHGEVYGEIKFGGYLDEDKASEATYKKCIINSLLFFYGISDAYPEKISEALARELFQRLARCAYSLDEEKFFNCISQENK